MAEQSNGNGKGKTEGGVDAQQAAVQAQVVGQYIKDLSFENPNVGKLLGPKGDGPNIKVEVHVDATKVGDEVYESAINFKATAANKDMTFYDLEIVYAGLFRLQNIPEQALEPFLLINCPTLIFPFLRRIIADVTREGGFPPLLMDPIDFAQLFMRRQKEIAAAATGGKA
ncbi:MAG: protein-export chaperone SecB [Hyphomicrobium sp.]|nr:protein-export chaperone SecB [Hyphomicrobium sp.]